MSEDTEEQAREQEEGLVKALDRGDVRRRRRLSALAADELATRGPIKKRKKKKKIGPIIVKERRKNKAKDAEERDRETGTEPARSCKCASERSTQTGKKEGKGERVTESEEGETSDASFKNGSIG